MGTKKMTLFLVLSFYVFNNRNGFLGKIKVEILLSLRFHNKEWLSGIKILLQGTLVPVKPFLFVETCISKVLK